MLNATAPKTVPIVPPARRPRSAPWSRKFGSEMSYRPNRLSAKKTNRPARNRFMYGLTESDWNAASRKTADAPSTAMIVRQ